MNFGDKTRSVTVRLTPEQYAFLEQSARSLEVSPSRFLRMVVNATMIGTGIASEASAKAVDQVEHAKADLNDLLEQ